MRAMTRTLERLGDRLLSALVPKAAADAGCVTDPYNYYKLCYCYEGATTCCYYQTCHVYSNCTESCTNYCNKETCW